MVINGYRFNKITNWHVEYLKENYSEKITDLERSLGLCDETIYRMLKALGIERSRRWKDSDFALRTPEAEEMLKNPYLSHAYIAKIFDCSATSVSQYRKKMGVPPRSNMCMTLLELEVSKTLNSIGLAYIQQRKVSKWSFDFFLGLDHYIDVHGDWAHSKPKNAERDARKREWASQNGLSYLVILESQIKDCESMIREFVPWVSLSSNTERTTL